MLRDISNINVSESIALSFDEGDALVLVGDNRTAKVEVMRSSTKC